jgi:hypothetical protein
MSAKYLRAIAAAVGFALAAPAAALADEVDHATVGAECTGYTFSTVGKHLKATDKYEVKYWFGLKLADGTVWDVNGSLPVTAQDDEGHFTANLFEGWGPLPKARYKFSYGHATLVDDTSGETLNTAYIVFTPKCFRCGKLCATQTENSSGFNGTQIAAGNYIWFNSNFRGLHVPKSGATLYFTHQTINFTAGGKSYSLPVPNAQVEFSLTATCSTTTYDAQTDTWLTTVPARRENEVWLSGLSYQVPADFGQVEGNVTWNGTLSSTDKGVGAQWKWGAAVYSKLTGDYNKVMPKAGHRTSCQFPDGAHAGTPEGSDETGTPWKSYLVTGAMGHGGSNYTGNFSAEIAALPVCND